MGASLGGKNAGDHVRDFGLVFFSWSCCVCTVRCMPVLAPPAGQLHAGVGCPDLLKRFSPLCPCERTKHKRTEGSNKRIERARVRGAGAQAQKTGPPCVRKGKREREERSACLSYPDQGLGVVSRLTPDLGGTSPRLRPLSDGGVPVAAALSARQRRLDPVTVTT